MDALQEEGDEDLKRCWICGQEVVLYEITDGKVMCYSCLLRQQKEQVSLDVFIS